MIISDNTTSSSIGVKPAGIFDRGLGRGDDLRPEQAGQRAFTAVRQLRVQPLWVTFVVRPSNLAFNFADAEPLFDKSPSHLSKAAPNAAVCLDLPIQNIEVRLLLRIGVAISAWQPFDSLIWRHLLNNIIPKVSAIFIPMRSYTPQDTGSTCNSEAPHADPTKSTQAAISRLH